MSLSDAALIVRIIERDDRHAFAELVRRHQSAIRAMLRRLTCGDDAVADDLAQETFLKAYRGLRTFRGGAKFSSWLHRIAHNVFVSHHRKKRPVPIGHLAEERAKSSPSEAGRTLVRRDLERAMQTLSAPERTAIALTYSRDASYEEIAEILNVPMGTVKTHLFRARSKLSKELADWRERSAP